MTFLIIWLSFGILGYGIFTYVEKVILKTRGNLLNFRDLTISLICGWIIFVWSLFLLLLYLKDDSQETN